MSFYCKYLQWLVRWLRHVLSRMPWYARSRKEHFCISGKRSGHSTGTESGLRLATAIDANRRFLRNEYTMTESTLFTRASKGSRQSDTITGPYRTPPPRLGKTRWAGILLSLLPAGPGIAQTRISGDQTQILTNLQTATSYTVQASDCGKLVSFGNAQPVAVTLPQAGTDIAAGCWIQLQNMGVGAVTITPAISTIDGAASVQLTSGAGMLLISSGGQYYTQRGQASGGAGNGGAGNGESGSVEPSSAAQLAYYPAAGSTVSGSGCTVGGSSNGDLACNSLSSNGLVQGEIDLFPAANATSYIGLAAPSSVVSTYTMQLPRTVPANQVLSFGPPLNGVAYGSWVDAIVLTGIGSAALIPNPSIFSGQYYIATDSADCATSSGSTNTLCRSTGTAWVPVGGGSVIPGSDGQVYTSDSSRPANPGFEYTPYLPMPGVNDANWSPYGTVNGSMTHTQTANGGRVFFQVTGSNVPEIHGRTIPVSSTADFTHIIADIVNEDTHDSNGMDEGVFFTDGTSYSACGLESNGSPADTFVGYRATSSNGSPTAYTLASNPAMPWGYSGPRYWQLSWTLSTHTLACSFSVDGYTWRPVWSDATPFLTPSAVGYYTNQNYVNSFLANHIVFGYR